MNYSSTNSKLLQPVATVALLLAMLFQLGACPCGCIEHNAWANWLGIGTELDANHGSSATFAGHDGGALRVVIASNDHDCTGQPRAQYLDNSNTHPTSADDLCSVTSIPSALLAEDDALVPYLRGNVRPSSVSALAHALFRPTLQVYRL